MSVFGPVEFIFAHFSFVLSLSIYRQLCWNNLAASLGTSQINFNFKL